MRVDRRGFLKTAAVSLAASACGGSAPCDTSAKPGEANVCPPGNLPGNDYFERLTADLASGFGTPQIIVELDALEANAKEIVTAVGASRYRIVEKSLPSLDLLARVNDLTGSPNRFLVLHLPFLPALLRRFPGAQVLIGKPQPIKAVEALFAAVPDADQSVVFLADTTDRAHELVALARQLKRQLTVSVEIDVGLHRGGVRRPALLSEVLSVFTANPGELELGGLLGYDGHVSGAPSMPNLEERTARAAFKTATDTYQAFVDVLYDRFGSLVRDDLIFNSGGSSTYPLYTSGPVNDVAAGGGMLRPAHAGGLFTAALQPAVFIATPVLAHFDKLEVPYVTNLTEGMTDRGQGFTIYGGGWPANFIYPQGVSLAPFVTDADGQNQVPNESWMVSPEGKTLLPGDWVWLQPRQADAIFQWEEILVARGGRLTGERWKAYPRRY